jgi:hypothetical protein
LPKSTSRFFRKLDAYEGDSSIKAAFELLLSAVRPGELRGAAGAKWTIPVTVANSGRPNEDVNEHLVPLSTQALAVLQRMRTMSGEHG